MQTSPARRVLRLRVTLTRSDPLIWRTLTIDDDATMADLDQAIRALFGWSDDGHHVFTTEYPPFDDDADPDEECRHRSPWDEEGPDASRLERCFLPAVRNWYGGEPAVRLAPREPQWAGAPRGEFGAAVAVYPLRRWGDRWSMIDLRDPEITDERHASVAGVVSAASPLFYQYAAECTWWCGIELLARDYAPSSAARATLDGGARRAPLQSVAGVSAHNTLMAAYRDAQHPDHHEAVERLTREVGPWASYDPDDVDVATVDAALAGRLPWMTVTRPGTRWRADEPARHDGLSAALGRMVDAFPPAAQSGLRRHLRDHGLLADVAPPAPDEAEALLRPFLRLIEGIGSAGAAIDADGSPPDAVIAAVGDATGDGATVAEILDAARALRLFYRRTGRMRVPRRVGDLHGDPVALWRLLTSELRLAWRYSDTSEWLFLLAVVDGSLADGSWVRRAEAALESIAHGREARHEAGLRDSRAWGYAEGLFSHPRSSSTPAATVLAALGLARSSTDQWAVPTGLPRFAHAILQ